MSTCCSVQTPASPPTRTKLQAVAYYRTSVLTGQDHAIQTQRDQIRAWAEYHGFEIIHEFVDAGDDGTPDGDRPALHHMIEHWLGDRDEVVHIFCLEPTRCTRSMCSSNASALPSTAAS